MEVRSGSIGLASGKHPLRVEFFENGGGAGIIMQWKGPDVSKAVVPASALTRIASEMKVTAAANVQGDVKGLNVQYYNLGGEKSKLPDFSALKPTRTDVSDQINFPSTDGNFATSEARDHVGAVWTGFINVPSSGSWDLFLDSDDGSKLFIGDKLIVNNDGLHGMEVRSGHIALGAGKHPLRVEFFENGGGAGIIMQWKGPGVSKAVVPASALTRTEAAVVKVARDALDAQKGDYKTLFVAMMKQIKSGLATMKAEAETEFQAITSKRDAVKDILASRIASAQAKDKEFSSATAAFDAADKACTSAKNTATAASATLKATTDSLNARNPIIEKELAVIRQLVDKVGELKSINLQESSGQEAARSSAYQRTRDLIGALQTFEDEAAPLSEMIEMAREHAEFTQPIVKLLKDLEAKLLAELNSLRSDVASAQSANTNAQSNQKSTCELREAKRLEEASAKNQLTSANSARDSTQQEFNDLQKLWESTRTKTEAALQTFTQEMITLNSLESCAVQAVNPVRKSCWEIKSVHPDAPSGVYKIRGPSGEPLSVQCDMTKQGGGWTLAGVAIFGEHGKAGWNSESFLNQGSSGSLSSHWHMSSDFMNSIAENGEYRANCFESTNDYERLWKGVRNYKWSQTTSASSSTSLDGVNQFPTGWAGHHWGLTSGNNERDAVITSHSDNQWACAGNQGPKGEGYTGRGGRSNMRIWLR